MRFFQGIHTIILKIGRYINVSYKKYRAIENICYSLSNFLIKQ